MARLASCPNCNHELLVPDHTDDRASATCPQCSAQFALNEVRAREIPLAIVSEPQSPPAWDQPAPGSAPTIDEVSGPVFKSATHESPAAKIPGTESQEEAAQRIDAWFRSAKTLSEIPSDALAPESQPEESDSSANALDADIGLYSEHAPIERDYVAPPSREENDATIDMGADGPRLAELNSEFALGAAAEALPNTPAWDDSQHMDQLLADLEKQGPDEFVASSESPDEQHAAVVEHEPMWSPEVPLAMTPGMSEPRRKRSLVTTMLFTVVGGIVGLALGYFALLWIQGPKIDFLDLAKFIPKAALPRSFRPEAESQQLPAPDRAAPVASASSTDTSDVAVSKSSEQPAAKQAAFTEPASEPAAPAKSQTTSDDRFPAAPPKIETKLQEPAPFNAPPAKPIIPEPSARQSETIHVASAPSFSNADVAAALQAAKEAEPKLIAGSLSDSKEVQQAKGRSYMTLADLAQKATFAAQAPGSDASKLSPEVQQFFRQTLADKHAREEVAQIAEKWLSHANRPQNGIFFAATIVRHETKGSMTECTVDLGNGQQLTVIVPASESAVENSTRPVAVVGAIVEQPADRISGYTGNLTKVIVTNALIPLD